MKRACAVSLALLALVFAAGKDLRADVKTEEKSLVKFEGLMGRMMGIFGGKAAKEGIINKVAVKGNRKMTASDFSGEIIDLDEQKVYTLDMRKKTYEVVTFDEMRRRMQEAQEKATKVAKEQKEEEPAGDQKEMEVDFSLKESGQKRTINGFDCREVVMTITAREKGKTLEQGGGFVMTSHTWLAPKIPAMQEIADFDMRYFKALESPYAMGGSADQMAMALAMYPAMKDMMGKMQAENVNMDGTAILTEMTTEAVKSPEEASRESKSGSESTSITSIRGIGGLFGRKAARQKEEQGTQKNRATIMTMTHELISAVPGVAPADVTIPAGFKQKK